MIDEFENRNNLLGIVSFGSQEVLLTRANPKDLDLLEVLVYSDDPPEKGIEYARDEIQRTRWWLQDHWLEKGLPHEQIEMTDGSHNVTIYNYFRKLSTRQLATISRVLGVFSAIKGGVIFDQLRYILIDDTKEIYSKTGKPRNGLARSDWGTIVLYPDGLSDQPSELSDNITRAEWTMTHECSHFLEEIKRDDQGSFIEGWKRVGNWRMNSQGRILSGGAVSIWETDEPQRCINERAQADFQEDLAESNTARIFAPEKLDSQKEDYLQQWAPLNREEQSKCNTTKIPAGYIRLPNTPAEFKIKVRIHPGKKPIVIFEKKE